MSDKHDEPSAYQKLWAKIKEVRIAMMTTREADGTLRSRPMGTQQSESDGELWFFTGYDSGKVDELRRNPHVNLSYGAPDKNLYVSVSGTAEIVRDAAKAKELWNPFLKAWFPKGLDDPDLALLRVTVTQAEYWDSPDSKVVTLVGFVKAIVTGQQADGGENEKLDLS